MRALKAQLPSLTFPWLFIRLHGETSLMATARLNGVFLSILHQSQPLGHYRILHTENMKFSQGTDMHTCDTSTQVATEGFGVPALCSRLTREPLPQKQKAQNLIFSNFFLRASPSSNLTQKHSIAVTKLFLAVFSWSEFTYLSKNNKIKSIAEPSIS